MADHISEERSEIANITELSKRLSSDDVTDSFPIYNLLP